MDEVKIIREGVGYNLLPVQTVALRMEALQRACATSTATSTTFAISCRAEKFLKFLEMGACTPLLESGTEAVDHERRALWAASHMGTYRKPTVGKDFD